MKTHAHVKEIRQIGLMAGIELTKNRNLNQPYESQARMGLKVCDAAP